MPKPNKKKTAARKPAAKKTRRPSAKPVQGASGPSTLNQMVPPLTFRIDGVPILPKQT